MKLRQKKRHEMDMCNGPLVGKILLFALPLMASSLLQLLFNAADAVVVGRFAGKEALAAVGSNVSLINLLINLFIGVSVGTNVIASQDMGAGRMDQVKKSVHTSITMALSFGILMTIFGVLSVRMLLQLTASPTDIIDLATVYLRIYFLGMPANLLYNFGASILRSQGDTRRPLYYLTLSGFVNVALNLFFVVVLKIDVAGVAIATVISQYLSAFLILRCLSREEGPTRLEWRNLGIEWGTARRILRVGLPAGFQGCLFSFANVVLQTGLNSFNDATLVAGSTTAMNIESFIYVTLNAFTQTAITFTGQNYGAGKCERVDRVALICQSFSFGVGLVLGNLAYLFGRQLASIYVPGQEAVIDQAMIRMMIIFCPYCICSIMDTIVGVVQGLGCSTAPMITSLLGVCGFRLLWVAFVFPHFRTPEMLYITFPVTWVLTSIAQVTIFFIVRKRAYAKVRNGPLPGGVSADI